MDGRDSAVIRDQRSRMSSSRRAFGAPESIYRGYQQPVSASLSGALTDPSGSLPTGAHAKRLP